MKFSAFAAKIAVAITGCCVSVTCFAFTYKKDGDMLRLSGSFEQSDIVRLDQELTPDIKYLNLVFLGTGGGWSDGKALHEVVRKKRITTVISGYCAGWACPMMFLAGAERVFAEAERPAINHIAFQVGVGMAVVSGEQGVTMDDVTSWWRDHTKLSWGFLSRQAGSYLRWGVLVYFPQGVAASIGPALQCEKGFSVQECNAVRGTDALAAGVITSNEAMKDPRLPQYSDLKKLPAETNVAALTAPPPLSLSEECEEKYKQFLKDDKPRAFAVNNDGTCAGTHSLSPRPYGDALYRCKQASKDKTNCVLYAVDDQVVYPASLLNKK